MSAPRAAGSLASVVGFGALLAPRSLGAVLGLPSDQMSAAADLGWRLFGVRTSALGIAAAAGSPLAV